MAGRWLLHVALALTLITFARSASVATPAPRAIMALQEGVDRDKQGTLELYKEKTHTLLIVGDNFTNETEIAFIHGGVPKTDCSKERLFKPTLIEEGKGAHYSVELEHLDPGEEFHLCILTDNPDEPWVDLDDPFLRIRIVKLIEDDASTILPLPVQVIVILFLLCLSGLFSGLNLGLMALDKTELKIIEKCGSATEKKYARLIVPLRKRGNFLLCTLLLGNVLVNSSATILMDDLSNGIIAVAASTICIVVFGEIIPQAICSRHGLAVGAKTSWITKIFMFLTFPLSFPISLLLDKILGEEIGQVYDKEKLQELIRMTADHKVLQNEEANIIAGALQLANKRVEDVMTKMEDVYMLDINTILDFETMAEILKFGYTRVPVYDGDKTNIVHLLNTKELALIDPDDNTALKTVCRFYDHRPLFVDNDMKLDQMLQDFLQGNSHMAIVQCLHNDGDHDPYFENIGVITLEDVIEEIIQSEIIDETDILTDNRRKKPRHREKLDYNVFEQKQEHGPRISQQVAFAAFQYLSTAVEPFKEQYVTRNVLKQLIRQNIVITLTPSTEDSEKNYIYEKDRECDYFVLLLEGHVEVEIGKEKMVFESGPFSYFGGECLDSLKDLKMEALRDPKDLRNLPPYKPDFSVKALTAVQYLRIRRVHYLAAKRTTYMITSTAAEADHQEAFHKEWRRAIAGKDSLSRNGSGVGMAEVLAEGKPAKKKSLLYGNATPVHPMTTKADLEDHSTDVLKSQTKEKLNQNTNASTEVGGSSENVTESEMSLESADKSKPSLDSSDVPAVEIRDGRTLSECNSETSSLLPKQKPGQKGLGEVVSSPEDGGEAEKGVVGDKIPLMGAKDSRSGSDKAWIEEEEGETAPLVGQDKNGGVKDGKLVKL